MIHENRLRISVKMDISSGTRATSTSTKQTDAKSVLTVLLVEQRYHSINTVRSQVFIFFSLQIGSDLAQLCLILHTVQEDLPSLAIKCPTILVRPKL